MLAGVSQQGSPSDATAALRALPVHHAASRAALLHDGRGRQRRPAGRRAARSYAIDRACESAAANAVANQQFCNQVELGGRTCMPTRTCRASRGARRDVSRRSKECWSTQRHGRAVRRTAAIDRTKSEPADFSPCGSADEKLHTVLALAAPGWRTATIAPASPFTAMLPTPPTGKAPARCSAMATPPKVAVLHAQPVAAHLDIAAPTAAGATSTLAVKVNELQWSESRTISPRSRSKSARLRHARDRGPENDGHLRERGAGATRPTGTANVKASIATGIGRAGNVEAGRDQPARHSPAGCAGSDQPTPGQRRGRRRTGSIRRGNTPIAVMALDRLVSVQDYADFGAPSRHRQGELTCASPTAAHWSCTSPSRVPRISPSTRRPTFTRTVLTRSSTATHTCRSRWRCASVKLLVISAPSRSWHGIRLGVGGAGRCDAFSRRSLRAEGPRPDRLPERGDRRQQRGRRRLRGLSKSSTASPRTSPRPNWPDWRTLASNMLHRGGPGREVNPTASDPAKRIYILAELVILTPDIPGHVILTEIT